MNVIAKLLPLRSSINTLTIPAYSKFVFCCTKEHVSYLLSIPPRLPIPADIRIHSRNHIALHCCKCSCNRAAHSTALNRVVRNKSRLAERRSNIARMRASAYHVIARMVARTIFQEIVVDLGAIGEIF